MGRKLRGSRRVAFISSLWVVQSVGRLFFAALGTPTGMGRFLDTPVSSTVSFLLFTMFLSLGVLGLIAALGLLARRKWGLWLTIIASVATIVFDAWGLTIQLTAAIGLIVPVISILVLYPRRSQLFTAAS
ncbi:MAG: hypothetical protein QXK88_04845 [Desulfurococcaceae archaeon]